MPTSINIDISIFTEEGAYGMITGDIPVPDLPQVGDTIAFAQGFEVDEIIAAVSTLKVTGRIVTAGEQEILFPLSDITVKTKDDAEKVMAFFEDKYDLFGLPFRDEDVVARRKK